MDYREAGVDIDTEAEFIKALVAGLTFKRKDMRTAPLNLGFTGLIEFGEYYLALNTDGVGTKIIIASALRKWDTIGIDCIAMNVNDTITVGAEPVAFVDYLAIDSYDLDMAEQLGRGLNAGAEEANITVLGGETATIPEITKGADLSGTALGIVKKDKLITGEMVKEGDLIYGLPSSGIHSNGLTLARRIFSDLEEKIHGTEIGLELLRPTRIYVREIMSILPECDVHGMAHITGGGLLNLLRVKKMEYVLDSPLKPQWLFTEIQERGNISDEEMYRTFNMGMGFALIAPEHCEELLRKNINARVVGHVERGNGASVPEMGIHLTP
ncbi:MAG: phosphoribosylformylglycinamidine cyclo-ligase [Euryarchaeota archaeon]|nr:phosphoribosylformylglycinamidine cyclo-ligase [Euryarchaeota archaeon]